MDGDDCSCPTPRAGSGSGIRSSARRFVDAIPGPDLPSAACARCRHHAGRAGRTRTMGIRGRISTMRTAPPPRQHEGFRSLSRPPPNHAADLAFEESTALLHAASAMLEHTPPSSLRARDVCGRCCCSASATISTRSPTQMPQAETFQEAARLRPRDDLLALARLQLRLGASYMLRRRRSDYSCAYERAVRARSVSSPHRGLGWKRTWIEAPARATAKRASLFDIPEASADSVELERAITESATAEQRARFFAMQAQSRAAARRFGGDRRMLDLAARSRSLAEASGVSPQLRGWLDTGYGSLLMWAGRYDEAETVCCARRFNWGRDARIR